MMVSHTFPVPPPQLLLLSRRYKVGQYSVFIKEVEGMKTDGKNSQRIIYLTEFVPLAFI